MATTGLEAAQAAAELGPLPKLLVGARLMQRMRYCHLICPLRHATQLMNLVVIGSARLI